MNTWKIEVEEIISFNFTMHVDRLVYLYLYKLMTSLDSRHWGIAWLVLFVKCTSGEGIAYFKILNTLTFQENVH